MTPHVKETRVNVIPTLRYSDAAAAIEWLCRAFGFEENLVVPGENGTIAHAQLRFGKGMVMLGSARDDPYGSFVKPPSELAGATTQSAYVIVDDADAHCARATRAGAEILMPVEDQHYGGRLYTCRDPQGHVWSFGTYDPWESR